MVEELDEAVKWAFGLRVLVAVAAAVRWRFPQMESLRFLQAAFDRNRAEAMSMILPRRSSQQRCGAAD